MVTEWMPADLGQIIKAQSLSDQHVQFFVYQIVRALKVTICDCCAVFCVNDVFNKCLRNWRVFCVQQVMHMIRKQFMQLI